MTARKTVKPPKWRYSPDLDGRVEAEYDPSIDRPYQTGRAYRVFRDGEPVGIVFRSTRTWERKTPGRTYVNARGETPCWRTSPPRPWSTFDTMAEAAYALAEENP